MISDRKCGTCKHFRVRPTEVELARIAKPMSACGPGSYCHGGPVRGWCDEHNTMRESTGVCPMFKPGGPQIRQAGQTGVPALAAQGSMAKQASDVVTEAVERAGELATTEGNVLAFSVVGLLALGSMLSNDWRWEGENLTGKPTVKGSDGRVYTYELSKGRQRVTIYLPTGRLVEHTVTAAAARDKRQLADEVSALVEDLYLIG